MERWRTGVRNVCIKKLIGIWLFKIVMIAVNMYFIAVNPVLIESMYSFFFLVHHKKRGEEEKATKNESLIGACRNRVSAWLTSWSFSLSDIQCFMSLDWQTDHFWQKINLKMKERNISFIYDTWFFLVGAIFLFF